MQPERWGGKNGGGLAVPMGWLCAEYIAAEALRTSCLVECGSLEFRAGRETLALTIFLCAGTEELSDVRAGTRLDEWLSLTAYAHPWPEWVRERLAARAEAAHGGDPDLTLARSAWHWLRATELLAADLADAERRHPSRSANPNVDESVQVWTPAWQLGLPLGHLAVNLL